MAGQVALILIICTLFVAFTIWAETRDGGE
jgi:hypothetical protein